MTATTLPPRLDIEAASAAIADLTRRMDAVETQQRAIRDILERLAASASTPPMRPSIVPSPERVMAVVRPVVEDADFERVRAQKDLANHFTHWKKYRVFCAQCARTHATLNERPVGMGKCPDCDEPLRWSEVTT